ncbi:MAG: acyltransferase domain-containing protein [Eubacteriales bacterium]|nr:acyltransferase domain-containing protein [Eubacteriales bacterium]
MRAYIDEICRELDFPPEAADAMLEAWDAVAAEPETYRIWQKRTAEYEKENYAEEESGADAGHMNFKEALADIDIAAQKAGIHKYTAQLLFFLCLTRHLKQLYEARNLDLKIWHDSCMDLRWKLMECHNMYGIWGSFVAWWFAGFFELKLFVLGRLEFELIDFPESYEKAGRTKPEGMTKAINVHIPSCGKLEMADCHDSYRRAAAFFADAFPGRQAAFYCWSWMLFAPHKAFLNPDSGIVRFMDEYDIYRTGCDNGDLWRIFNAEYHGDAEKLSENTSLQRGYKSWLKAGNSAGFGEGIFFLDKTK